MFCVKFSFFLHQMRVVNFIRGPLPMLLYKMAMRPTWLLSGQ